MPKIVKPLSSLQIKRLSKVVGFHCVGGVPGLHLHVTETEAGDNTCASWILRAMIGDARRDRGLGRYDEVPDSVARDRARAARDLIRQGIDPLQAKREAREKRRTE